MKKEDWKEFFNRCLDSASRGEIATKNKPQYADDHNAFLFCKVLFSILHRNM